MILSRAGWSRVLGAGILVAFSVAPALAADGPKTPEEFAAQYMAAINAGDVATLKKLHYSAEGDSAEFNEFRNAMIQANIAGGQKYTKYTVLPAPDKQESTGPDGKLYVPNLKITNQIKLTQVTDSGTSSEQFPIGEKDGIYYDVGVKLAPAAADHNAAQK